MVFDLFNRQPSNNQQSTPQRPIVNRSTKTYEDKLAEEQYELFTSRDVVEHFERHHRKWCGEQSKQNVSNAIRVTEELFQSGLTPEDLTLYIEFVFDSDQTKIDRCKCAMGTFKIKDFVDYIEENIDDFLNGKSVKGKETRDVFNSNIDRRREWSRERGGRVKFEVSRYF